MAADKTTISGIGVTIRVKIFLSDDNEASESRLCFRGRGTKVNNLLVSISKTDL